MSFWFETVKRFYDMGYPGYTDEGIKIFVKVKDITPKEYELITGVPYTK